MYKIVKATSKDAKLLSKIGIESFLTAHGHSAPKKDIDNYITNNLSEVNFTSELKDLKNIFHLLYVHNKLAGYSKVIFNKTNINVSNKNVTNMSRLYLLKDFYGLGLGKILLDFNIKLCKENKQSGLWLVVWVENQKQ